MGQTFEVNAVISFLDQNRKLKKVEVGFFASSLQLAYGIISARIETIEQNKGYTYTGFIQLTVKEH